MFLFHRLTSADTLEFTRLCTPRVRRLHPKARTTLHDCMHIFEKGKPKKDTKGEDTKKDTMPPRMSFASVLQPRKRIPTPPPPPVYHTLIHGRRMNKSDHSHESRTRIIDNIMEHTAAALGHQRLLLLNRGLAELEKTGSGHKALERGVYLCHATPVTLLPGGLRPMSYNFLDAIWPKTAVATLWFTSSLRRAAEHCADSHYSAMHALGLRIILVGPGAPANFHVKVLVPVAANSGRGGSGTGIDFQTTASLPPISTDEPWNFGPDTMVIEVAGAMGATPWAVRIIHDSLLSDQEQAATAIRVCNETYFGLAKGCSTCGYGEKGCVHCNTRRGIAGRVENITAGIYKSNHKCHKLIGRRISKLFEDGEWYTGTIHSYRRGLYEINYDDGDSEWLTDDKQYLTSRLLDD